METSSSGSNNLKISCVIVYDADDLQKTTNNIHKQTSCTHNKNKREKRQKHRYKTNEDQPGTKAM